MNHGEIVSFLRVVADHTRLAPDGEMIRPPLNPNAEVHLFGQEVNPETWAVSKSDLFMKDPTGREAATSRTEACCPTIATRGGASTTSPARR